MKKLYKRLTLKNGSTVSVQASETHYCTPKNDVGPYSTVEVGFPDVKPTGKLLDHIDESGVVYPFVPYGVLEEYIEEHGGIVDGEMPEMVKDDDEILKEIT